MNLVSVREDAEIPLKHFIDALSPIPFMPHEKLSILDIGTGPGLPGIPMKIAVDEWHFFLLEASRKRISFLKETIRQLGLQNISVIHERTENLIMQKQYHQAFSVVISRATLKLPQLIETANYFLDVGGCLIAMKGNIPEKEWLESVHVAENTKLFYLETHHLRLPATNAPREILIYKKLNEFK